MSLFATPHIAASQAPLPFTLSQSLLKFLSIESVILSNQPSHLLLPPSFALNLSQHLVPFKWVSSLHQVAKVLELQCQSFQWIFGLTFFRIDWFVLLAVQGTLESLLQHHNLKTSILWHSAFFMVSPLYMTTGKTMCVCVVGVCVCTCTHASSVVSDSQTPRTVAHQALLSMGFSRQEHWSGLPFHSPGDLHDPGIEPASLASSSLASKFFTTSITWEAPFDYTDLWLSSKTQT